MLAAVQVRDYCSPAQAVGCQKIKNKKDHRPHANSPNSFSLGSSHRMRAVEMRMIIPLYTEEELLEKRTVWKKYNQYFLPFYF